MPDDLATSIDFARSRARGRVKFDKAVVDDRTPRRELHESGSLRVRFPSPDDHGLSAVFVNTLVGVAGGDDFRVDITAGEAIRLTVTTPAAERIYRLLRRGWPVLLERICHGALLCSRFCETAARRDRRAWPCRREVATAVAELNSTIRTFNWHESP